MACSFCHRNHINPPRWLGPPWIPELRYLDCLKFLCDDRGHLLPQAKQYICKKTNHWGYPITNIWDEDFQCCPGHRQKRKCQTEIQWELDDMPRYFKCRGPLAACKDPNCSVLDNPKITSAVQDDFERLRRQAPPVVWILGYPSDTLTSLRLYFGEQLAKFLGFIYLDLDCLLSSLATKYLNYCPCPKSARRQATPPAKDSFLNSLPANLDNCPFHVQRLVLLVKNVLWYKSRAEAFNTIGILEVIKMAFLCYPSASGFVVDKFPISFGEGQNYECVFWPVAAGIYFMSEKWVKSKNRACNPRLCVPKIFLRSEAYLEKLVYQTADEFGCKMIKVPCAECLGECDLQYIQVVVRELIRQYTSVSGSAMPTDRQLDDELRNLLEREQKENPQPDDSKQQNLKRRRQTAYAITDIEATDIDQSEIQNDSDVQQEIEDEVMPDRVPTKEVIENDDTEDPPTTNNSRKRQEYSAIVADLVVETPLRLQTKSLNDLSPIPNRWQRTPSLERNSTSLEDIPFSQDKSVHAPPREFTQETNQLSEVGVKKLKAQKHKIKKNQLVVNSLTVNNVHLSTQRFSSTEKIAIDTEFRDDINENFALIVSDSSDTELPPVVQPQSSVNDENTSKNETSPESDSGSSDDSDITVINRKLSTNQLARRFTSKVQLIGGQDIESIWNGQDDMTDVSNSSSTDEHSTSSCSTEPDEFPYLW